MVNVTSFGWRWLFPIALIALGLFLTSWLSIKGFNQLEYMRQLERLHTVTPTEITINETATAGKATIHPTLTQLKASPRFKTDSIYYRYLHERLESCGDDDRCWRTVTDTSHHTPFYLQDPTSNTQVLVKPSHTVNWEVAKSQSVEQGDNRYTEWRIEPNDTLFLVGYTQWQLPTTINIDDYDSLNKQPVIEFDGSNHFYPVISNQGRDYVQGGLGGAGALYLAASLACLSFVIFGCVLLFRVHRTLVFLSICTVVTTLYLFNQSLLMMKMDFVKGVERYTEQRQDLEEFLRSEHRLNEWPGFHSPASIQDHTNTLLSKAERARIQTFKLQLALAHARIHDQSSRAPDRWLAPLWQSALPESIHLTDHEKNRIDDQFKPIQSPPFSRWYVWVVIAVSFVAMLILTKMGITRIKRKRLVENIALSRTAGVVPGMAELQGQAVIGDNFESVLSPLQGIECVWFHYIEEEKRRSGNKTSWHTVEDFKESTLFQLEDEEGRLAIHSNNAHIFTSNKKTQRQFDRKYTEYWLSVDEPIYALGPVNFKSTEDDARLVMEDNDEDFFILSNHEEDTVMRALAFNGFLALTLAIGSANLSFFTFNAAFGAFSALDFLLACIVTPIYLLFVMLVLHYNDLIFLRGMAERNYANINVSLTKRSKLIPNLEKLAAKYMTHEKELQQQVAKLRSDLSGYDPESPSDIHRIIEGERAATQQTLFRLEDYPKLKGAPVVKKMMNQFTRLETEIALLREGYNNAVEIYNTRINSIPDIAFKKLFKFEDMGLIHERD